MNQSLRHISFRRIGTSEVHLRYLEDDPDLRSLLGPRPKDADHLLKLAPIGAERLVPPAELGAALEAYAARHGASEKSIDAARAIGAGEAQVVVTGQQPGLFGGPLYTVFKVATAVRLARELSARPGAPRVVPVFWNHSDDHDLDEVNRAFFVNPNMDLQRVRVDVEHNGRAVRHIPIGAKIEHAMAAVSDLLPQTEFRDEMLALFEKRSDDETLGDQMARLLFRLFADDGLLVIEPRDLPRSAFDPLPGWFTRADEIRDRIRIASEHLSDLGFDVTLDPGTTLMFALHANGRRQALADGEEFEGPETLSPGVLLRPLWQDAVLPSLGFVVGPGELSYLAIIAPLYKALGVPRPAFVPRASLTLVEASMVKHLDRFGWDLPDLVEGPEVLARVLPEDGQGPAELALEDAISDVRQRLATVSDLLRESDPQMVGQLERTRGKVTDELDKLMVRVRNSRQNRQGTGLRQIRRLCAHLRPRGRMQERVLTIVPSLVAHGPAAIERLIAAADPFQIDHGVLQL
ncbi:MAG: bacillithiol biosynthesis cysteine-adding enzyme BshC [Planctomycetota bacterium]|nr:bacillithiol biosynthesis cysteine-adding enzyme BshC [Planctomycetota bacterium]MDA0931923.1 bacillithiol biosynthesis cysteine-adding enzyme BshC [Planctomycetota bacterium]